MTRAVLAACAALLALGACSAAQQAEERAAIDKADQALGKACLAREALKDAGPLLVTDGCPPDASDAYWRCTGAQHGP